MRLGLKKRCRVRQVGVRSVPADLTLWAYGMNVARTEDIVVDFEANLNRQREEGGRHSERASYGARLTLPSTMRRPIHLTASRVESSNKEYESRQWRCVVPERRSGSRYAKEEKLGLKFR